MKFFQIIFLIILAGTSGALLSYAAEKHDHPTLALAIGVMTCTLIGSWRLWRKL